jgi:CheY-like chemotaxis protein
MDIAMPVIDGLKVAQRLRDLQRNGQAAWFPILAVSGEDSPDLRKQAVHAGFDGWVEKPVRAVALRSAIANVLRPRHRHEAA